MNALTANILFLREVRAMSAGSSLANAYTVAWCQFLRGRGRPQRQVTHLQNQPVGNGFVTEDGIGSYVGASDI